MYVGHSCLETVTYELVTALTWEELQSINALYEMRVIERLLSFYGKYNIKSDQSNYFDYLILEVERSSKNFIFFFSHFISLLFFIIYAKSLKKYVIPVSWKVVMKGSSAFLNFNNP